MNLARARIAGVWVCGRVVVVVLVVWALVVVLSRVVVVSGIGSR